MANRVYLIPIESGVAGQRGPKYLPWRFDPDPPALVAPVSHGMLDFGLENHAIAVADVTQEEHTILAGEPDVIGIPANLDGTLGLNLGTVQTRLEAVGVPANHMVSSATWRATLRYVCGVFGFAQRYSALSGQSIHLDGVNLGLRMNQIPAAKRDLLEQAADELGYDVSNLTATSTIRLLLRTVGEQGGPVTIAGFTI